jgi:sulfide:quinone oxidoreductase
MNARRRVLIAGGGVAALEATLALHQLAAGTLEVELVASEPRFWYRPLAVAESFGLGDSRSFDLAELAQRAGALLTLDSVVAVDANEHAALTRRGARLGYDSLLLACGATPRATLDGALTFRGPGDTTRLADLVARLDAGEATRIVVAVPPGAVWSLPAYELALMLATPEDEPLLLFGPDASAALRVLLEEHRIALHTGFFAADLRGGALTLLPSGTIEADCVVALPVLRGQRIDGVPQTRDGFVVVDEHCRVEGLADVYAAGDITRFPLKQGGIAAQQADAAAAAIAADAGVILHPEPFRPVLRGLLLSGAAPRYLRRDIAAGQPGTVGLDPLWWPPAKLVGRHLAPFLAGLADVRHEPPDGLAVEVELEHVHASPLEDEPAEGSRTLAEVVAPWPLVVAPEDTLGEVAERMQAFDLGSALVADFGRLIGILTSRDLLRAFAGRVHSSEFRVREWMTAEPVSASPRTSLERALALMHEHEIHHLPVVDDGRLVGMVGMRALVRALDVPAGIGLGF